jgi:hypothetical protein
MRSDLSFTGTRLPMYRSLSGPWIIGSGKTEPITLEDAIYTKRFGPLDKHWHCVPRDRVFSLSFPAEYEVIHATKLYDERRRHAGQPLKLTWREAADIYADYWGGWIDQKAIAKKHKMTVLTAHRLVHRISYWFI